ncbi:MAG: hypothetical protein QM771_05530 [Nitrospira sp.]
MRPSPERPLQRPHHDIKNEERREWLRIDDRLLLEYQRADEPQEAMNQYLPPATEDTIATAVSKPTVDLLVRAGKRLPVLRSCRGYRKSTGCWRRFSSRWSRVIQAV